MWNDGEKNSDGSAFRPPICTCNGNIGRAFCADIADSTHSLYLYRYDDEGGVDLDRTNRIQQARTHTHTLEYTLCVEGNKGEHCIAWHSKIL